MSVGSIAQAGPARSAGQPRVGRLAAVNPSLAGLGALVALGAVLRFYGLARQGFWYDEANTVYLLHRSFGHMLGLLPVNESTPPLYYCLAWLWTRVFGIGQAGLRSLSALAGVLVIPVAYALGREAVSRRVGLVLAALVTFNPLLIWYSQEARSYILMVLLSSLSLLSARRALVRPEARTFAVWSLAAILSLLTHYYAILIVAPEAVWLLVAHRRRRSLQLAVAAVVVCGLALIPLALAQNGTHRDRWISNGALSIRLSQILPQLVIGTGAPDRLLLKFIGFAAAAGGLLLLARWADRTERRAGLWMAAMVLAGFGLNVVFMLAGYDDLITRNLLALAVPALFVLAAGLGARRAGWAGLLATAVLCVIGITAAAGVAADRGLQRPDWRPLARLLGPAPPRHGPGRALLIQDYRFLFPLSMYMPGLRRIAPKVGARVNQFDVITLSAPRQRLCWWGAGCNLYPSIPQLSYPIPGLHFVSERRVRQFTVLHFVFAHPVRIRPSMVAPALYETELGKDSLLFQP